MEINIKNKLNKKDKRRKNRKEGEEMKEEIKKLQKTLGKWNEKSILVREEGFFKSKYKIEKMKYDINYEILNIMEKKEEKYIKINMNQVYKIEEENERVKIYLDNDMTILLELEK